MSGDEVLCVLIAFPCVPVTMAKGIGNGFPLAAVVTTPGRTYYPCVFSAALTFGPSFFFLRNCQVYGPVFPLQHVWRESASLCRWFSCARCEHSTSVAR